MPSREILEPECYATLRVSADVCGGYLWDMNWAAISVSEVTDTEHEPLDDEFEEWQAIYETTDRTRDGAGRKAFDAQGEALAGKLHAFLGGRHTIIYRHAGSGTEVKLAANAPP